MTLSDVETRFASLSRDDLIEAHTLVALHQYESVPVYKRYCDALGLHPDRCYLPIQAFKDSDIACFDEQQAQAVFRSSGTTAMQRSRHYVKSLALYEKSIRASFLRYFGIPPVTILGHLPGYAESGGESSLVYMVEFLIHTFGEAGSGLFLDSLHLLDDAVSRNSPVLLFGAAFGLLNLTEQRRFALPQGSLIVETGGMKTQTIEITRSDLHQRLASGFGVGADNVWSEYGMCEMLSQAYRQPGGPFLFPEWVSWKLFDPTNPLREVHDGPGVLGIRDLANMHTVSAILTEDLAERSGSGFEILGRLKGSDLRGCNMLVESAR